MGNLSGEFREQNRKDKVTRFRSVTYARQLGLLVNTLGSHLKISLYIYIYIYQCLSSEAAGKIKKLATLVRPPLGLEILVVLTGSSK